MYEKQRDDRLEFRQLLDDEPFASYETLPIRPSSTKGFAFKEQVARSRSLKSMCI